MRSLCYHPFDNSGTRLTRAVPWSDRASTQREALKQRQLPRHPALRTKGQIAFPAEHIRAATLKRFSPGLNRGIPKRLAMMESFVH